MIPYPNSTAFNIGYFSGFINALAATVSVAHRILANIKISVIIKGSSLTHKLKTQIKKDSRINPIMVPIMPKNPMIAKFSKNSDFRREYPAEKIMGGRIIVKKISPEKTMLKWKAYFTKAAVRAPSNIDTADSWRHGTYNNNTTIYSFNID